VIRSIRMNLCCLALLLALVLVCCRVNALIVVLIGKLKGLDEGYYWYCDFEIFPFVSVSGRVGYSNGSL
jgi:hypothetical protein